MSDVGARIQRVEQTRQRVLAQVASLSEAAGAFKPSASEWSIEEIIEHLVLAEELGVLFIWRATLTPWQGETPHRGLSIEQVVAKTWKEKEVAPEPATPHFGGPLAYWCARLEGCQALLGALGKRLVGEDLESIVYPHVLSGPLDAGQRIDFLAFHMERHLQQVRSVKARPDFPA